MKTPEIDCYNAISMASRCQTTYHLPGLYGLDSLRRLQPATVDAMIILGSGASVYDALPWQSPLNRWVHARCLAGVPTLGLCYGHQLLAHIFGGKIDLLWDDQKAKGTRSVSIDGGPLLSQARADHLVVSHREGVIQLPTDFHVFGHSAQVQVDAMKHIRLPIWGFQPHIEATPAFLANNQIHADAEHAAAAYGFGACLMDAFYRQIRNSWRQSSTA
ncbi:MAG: gamma-glutamyl-gamma-aminobutyrate hydrolase family protein [Myxococcota bacterium]|nr:gamma-glutamyl-gamma-aminobutyrate hydrolase family protein [Myxococcota bacterium]